MKARTRHYVDQLVLPQTADHLRVRRAADELVEELDGDTREVGEHDDARDHRRPSTQKADVRTERLGGPGERGARVGHDPVELAIGVRGEEHRQEAGDDHHRCLGADGGRE